MIKISVIVPVYNCQDYLLECLTSLSAQTLGDKIEFIIIDDHSTDNSRQLIDKFIKNDKRFCLLDNQQKGTGSARNLGLAHAKGDYIGFLDADDFVDKDYYQALYQTGINEGADVVCALRRKEIYPDHQKEVLTPYHQDQELMKKQLVFTDNFLWLKIFKRDFITKYEIKNALTRRSQDVAFVLSAVLLADKISYCDQSCYYYRVHQDSASHQALQERDYHELGDIFAPLNYQSFTKSDQRLIEQKIIQSLRFYLSKASAQERVGVFYHVFKKLPYFEWQASDYRLESGIAKILLSFKK